MTSFSIRNFGCRVNQAEAFSWAERLQREGLKLEEDWSRSDLILVNSCTLTAHADRDVRKFVQKAVRVNPEARLVLTGCYVEREPNALAWIPQVRLVLGNGEKDGLAEKVLAMAGTRGEVRPIPFRSRALLKIQDGCDGRCAFCVVPGVRGRSRSLPQEQVLSSLERLAASGFAETVLAGIHLTSYGRDFVPPGSLERLLDTVGGVPGLGRIRLSSLDPRHLDDGLLQAMAGNPMVCQHFHLSLQHASDSVLVEMGRGPGREKYATILSRLRESSPEAALGADFIVGFPGEDEEDFEALYDFAGKSALTYGHVFSYSPRPGTAAADRPPVGDRVKSERSFRLRKLMSEKNFAFRRSFLGRELLGVVVGKRKGGLEAVTGNGIKVALPARSGLERSLLRVQITGLDSSRTHGQMVAGPAAGEAYP